jgi:DNA repair exonuclease SbcCD nuclease subunit
MKTVRGVLSGDWHFSNALPYAVDTFAGVTDRLRHLETAWRQMLDDAVEFNADFIAILGDLFDKSRPDPVTLKMVVDLVIAAADRKLRVLVMPGNHDGDLRGAFFFATEALGAMKHPLVTHLEVNRPIELAPWLELQPVPYAPLGSVEETLAELKSMPIPEGSQRIGLLHQAIVGAEHHGWTCPEGEGLDPILATDPFSFAFASHFHIAQAFGDGWGAYLGAPIQHHFGDVGDEKRGWWLVEFEEGADPKLTHARSRSLPRWRATTIDPDRPTDALVVLAAPDALSAGDYVRLTYKATHADKAAAIAKLDPAVARLREAGVVVFLKHEPVYHHEGRIDLDEAGPAETPSAFVRRAAEAYLAGPATLGELDPVELGRIAREVLDETFHEGEYAGGE